MATMFASEHHLDNARRRQRGDGMAVKLQQIRVFGRNVLLQLNNRGEGHDKGHLFGSGAVAVMKRESGWRCSGEAKGRQGAMWERGRQADKKARGVAPHHGVQERKHEEPNIARTCHHGVSSLLSRAAILSCGTESHMEQGKRIQTARRPYGVGSNPLPSRSVIFREAIIWTTDATTTNSERARTVMSFGEYEPNHRPSHTPKTVLPAAGMRGRVGPSCSARQGSSCSGSTGQASTWSRDRLRE